MGDIASMISCGCTKNMVRSPRIRVGEVRQFTRVAGPVVRTGPNELSLASPRAAKEVFTVGKGFRKTDFYWVFPPSNNPDVFTEIRDWKHTQLKRYTNAPYSLSSMLKKTSVIQEVEKDLFQKLDSFATKEKQKCNLGDWLHWFAFDVRHALKAQWLGADIPII